MKKIIHVFRSSDLYYEVYCRVRKTWVRFPSYRFSGEVSHVEPYTYTQKHVFLFESRIQHVSDFTKCFYYDINLGELVPVY